MSTEKNVTQNTIYKQFIYAVCTVLLLYIFYHEYYGFNSVLFGVLGQIVYILSCYCLVKSFKTINFKIILISSIFLALYFIWTTVIFQYYPPQITIKTLVVIISIRASMYIFTCFLVLFFSYIVLHNNSYNKLEIDKSIINLVILIVLGTLLCVAATDDAKYMQMSHYVFTYSLFLISALCSYHLYHISKKWYIASGILISLYFVSLRLLLFCFYTSEVYDTGWALTYIMSIIYSFLFIHVGSSIISSLILLIPVLNKHIK